MHCPCVYDRYRAVEARDARRMLVPVGHHVEASRGPVPPGGMAGQGYPIAMYQSHRRPFMPVYTEAYTSSHLFISHCLVGAQMTHSLLYVCPPHYIAVVLGLWAYRMCCRTFTDRTGGSCQPRI